MDTQACTPDRGWQKCEDRVGALWSRIPHWRNASPQTCRCQVGIQPRSALDDSNARRQHRLYHSQGLCSCPGTGGGSTHHPPCNLAVHTSLGTLEKAQKTELYQGIPKYVSFTLCSVNWQKATIKKNWMFFSTGRLGKQFNTSPCIVSARNRLIRDVTKASRLDHTSTTSVCLLTAIMDKVTNMCSVLSFEMKPPKHQWSKKSWQFRSEHKESLTVRSKGMLSHYWKISHQASTLRRVSPHLN